MKICYLCDACELVIDEEESPGEGLVFLRTMCDDCARELGIVTEGYRNSTSYYN